MPSYQFNHFTGRLNNSQQHNIQPLYPIKPVPLTKSDPPKMIWDIVNTKVMKTDTKNVAPYSTVSPKILAKMKKFQVDVSKPVYLMGGTPDKILFGISLTLVGVCAVLSFDFLSRNFYKK